MYLFVALMLSGTTAAEREPLVHGYSEDPTPEDSGDIFHKAQRFGGRGPDVGSAEAWPSPAKPDMSNIPPGTNTDAEGTRREGVMTKLMDKLHLNGHHSPTRTTATATTPTANTVTPPTTNRSVMQDTGAGMPTYSDKALDTGNSEGQATGPVEAF